jgi:glyceraldehyde-3-phosphate dehydrogenase (NADP+)
VVINETSDVRNDSKPICEIKKSGVGREVVKYAVLYLREHNNTIINLGEPTRRQQQGWLTERTP